VPVIFVRRTAQAKIKPERGNRTTEKRNNARTEGHNWTIPAPAKNRVLVKENEAGAGTIQLELADHQSWGNEVLHARLSLAPPW
jgi:hypothetical protein